MARLVIKDENNEVRKHELIDNVTTIGRKSSNTIPITDEKSSRYHFRIEKSGTGFKVIDLGSTNGTRLNDARVHQQQLKPGDVLRVGQTTFTYENEAEAATMPAPEINPGDTVVLPENMDLPEVKPAKSEPTGPKYVLEVVDGPDQGRIFELGHEAVTIGRHASNTFSLTDDSCSNYHAEVSKSPLGYVVSDLGSTNGTKLRTRNQSEFEKIVKTQLTQGARFKIGKTEIEFKNVGASAAQDEVLDTVVLDGDGVDPKLSRQFDEAQAKAAQDKASAGGGFKLPPVWIMGAASVAIFVGAIYGAIALLGNTSGDKVENTDVKPIKVAVVDTNNKLPNGNFSKGTTMLGEPQGWKLYPGEPGLRLSLSEEAEFDEHAEVKAGLVIVKSGAKSAARMSYAETEDIFAVDPGKTYELSGALMNDGDGLYGLRIRWIKQDQREMEEHPLVLVSTQRWKEIPVEVRPPVWADTCRVGVFAIGRHGKASFDNIVFKEKPNANVPALAPVSFSGVTVSFEGQKGHLSIASEGNLVVQDGMLELVSSDQKMVSSIVSAIAPQWNRQGEVTSCQGMLFDYVLQRPRNYQIEARTGAAGVLVRLAVDREEGGSKPRYSCFIVGAQARGDLEIYLDNGNIERLAATESRETGGVVGMLFNTGARPQLYVRFSSPIQLNTKREGQRRHLLMGFDGEMAIDFAPLNFAEKKELMDQVAQLKRFLSDRSWGNASALITQMDQRFRGRFPEADAEIEAARRQLSQGFNEVKLEIGQLVKNVQQFPSADAVDGAIAELRKKAVPWAGTAHEQEFTSAVTQLQGIKSTVLSDSKENEAQARLKRAKDHLQSPNLAHVAMSLLDMIVRDYPDSKAAAEARTLKSQAEAQVKKRDKLNDITDRLRKTCEPYIKAGRYLDAIKLVESDAEYKSNKGDLLELNDLLKRWREQIQ